VLSVESVRNEMTVRKLFESPVSVVLHSSCEYYNLKEVCHRSQEFSSKRPYKQYTAMNLVLRILFEMNESLVEI